MNDWRWGSRSKEKIETCHNILKRYLYWLEGRTPLELTVVWGFRNKEQQNEAYDRGNSGLRWPDSRHNHTHDGRPYSLAVDLAPWTPGHPSGSIPWGDKALFHCMGGMVLQAAEDYGIQLVWGSDWDGDWVTIEHSLDDPGHFQLADSVL